MVDIKYTATIRRNEEDGGNLYDVPMPFFNGTKEEMVEMSRIFKVHPEIRSITFKRIKGNGND